MAKKFLFGLTAFLGLSASLPSLGAVDCFDKITEVIVHSSGRTFFVTQNACSNAWCELKGDPTFVKQAYAALLTAKVTGGTVLFRWPALPSCDAKNDAYTTPEFIVLKQ